MSGRVLQVPKWDFENDRYMRDGSGKQVYVEVPTGDTLARVLAEEFGPIHTVHKNKADSLAGDAFLEKHSLRLYDVYTTYSKDYKDLDRVELRALMADSGLAPLFPTLVLEAVAEGFREVEVNWKDLISDTVNVTSGSIEDFQFIDNADTYDDYILKLIGEGSRIPTARVEVSGKKVYITDKGRGLDITDRAQSAPVSLSDTWLRKLGRKLARFYWKHIARRLKTGYFDDGSDAAHVIYTLTPGVWTLQDALLAINYLRDEHGFEATDMMASSATVIAWEVMTLPDGGGWVFPDGVAARLKLKGVHSNSEMGPDDIAFFDRDAALVRLELKPFGTETERTAGQRLTTLYATISDEIILADPKARVLLSKVDPTP